MKPRTGLSGDVLKWIALVCMLIDHIGWAFVPKESPLGFIMHLIGRITAPVMCFFISEGFFHTRSVPRYAGRLALFALISWPAFSLFRTGLPFLPRMGMIWTLLLGLLALWVYDRVGHPLFRALCVFGCILLSCIGDWPIFGVLYVLAFGASHPARGGSLKKQLLCFGAVSVLMLFTSFIQIVQTGRWETISMVLMQLGVVFALPLLFLYNGQRGGTPGTRLSVINKWAFYFFYPAHLLILAILRLYVF